MMTWYLTMFSVLSVTVFSLANTSYWWGSFFVRRITRQTLTILTSEVSRLKFYFQKLKKTCAVCEAIIDGVYYCGQDNKILCETHYKVVSGLQNKVFSRFISCRKCWAIVSGVERLWKEAFWRLREPNTTLLASLATSARSVWETAPPPSGVTNRGRSAASHVITSKLSLLTNFIILTDWLTARLFALKCAKCQLPIVPDQNETSVQRLRALNKDFHPDCFCCDVSFLFNLVIFL